MSDSTLKSPPNVEIPPLSRDLISLVFLAAVLAVNIILFLFLWLRFDDLPQLLPMHFDALGQADRIAPRSEIFVLPIIGLIVASTNLALGLYARQRSLFAAYMLWGGALLVELLLFIAAYNITR
jgi:uncharacterized membrane protein